MTLISDSHKDVIFTIACSLYVIYKLKVFFLQCIHLAIFFSDSTKPYLWSSCMGRKLIRTPLFNSSETDELPLEVSTLGGFVYCFALSPVNSAE